MWLSLNFPLAHAFSFVAMHFLAATGLVLALQGRRSRFVKFDLVPHITSAQEFVTTGRLPDRALLAVSLPTYHQEQPGF